MITSIDPLYAQYFSEFPTEEKSELTSKKDWTNFNSKDEDFSSPLSERQVDFSIEERTIEEPKAVDRVKSIASTVLKIAILSYLFYAFASPLILRIVPQTLQLRIIQLLPTHKVLEIASTYLGPSFNIVLAEVTKRGGALALKIILALGVLYKNGRYIVQRIIMLPLYPAQSRIVKLFFSDLSTGALNENRTRWAKDWKENGYIVRDVALEKNGVRYSGLLIGHPNTIHNGQWLLQATGNAEPIDYSAYYLTNIYKQARFNTLLINGPAVGRSEGQATPESMGDAQEVGIRFIEEALKAKKVVIAGRSLGGAAVGQAILQHEFKENIQYLVIRQMTFDRVSNIAAKTIGQISSRLEEPVARLIRWAECEIDSVAASQKLQQLGIKEVIVQASCEEINAGILPTIDQFLTDGPILAEASLGRTLIHEKITENKEFVCLPEAKHMTQDAAEKVVPYLEMLAITV